MFKRYKVLRGGSDDRGKENNLWNRNSLEKADWKLDKMKFDQRSNTFNDRDFYYCRR
jgi:hypothetical protein